MKCDDVDCDEWSSECGGTPKFTKLTKFTDPRHGLRGARDGYSIGSRSNIHRCEHGGLREPQHGARGVRMAMTTKAEQETIIRWDQEARILDLYTAYPSQVRKWTRLGYQVEVSDRTQAGEPRGWRAKAPLGALRFR